VFDIVEKLSNFLLEIITVVSSANKMVSDKAFIFGGRSFIYIYLYYEQKKALKLTPGELHVLLFPILRKISQMI
jgi:hypothetical protein